ncbi:MULTISPECIES: hypothetical protein [Micrococcaceae]|uniref:hypothetical protein n=1 Tax=unclassified Kocuria TaxID=2649579 RepID=UPI0010119978|nr:MULTISPECIES: hypothetical protein [unclassified Kocuria]
MTRTQVITRKASMTAAGVALALGAGVLGMGPAQAETPSASDSAATPQAEETQHSAPASLDQAVLVKSVTDPTVYYLKVPSPHGIGEAPAPDGMYSVDIVIGDQTEHFTVEAKDGRFDLKDSHILNTSEFEPYVIVDWMG